MARLIKRILYCAAVLVIITLIKEGYFLWLDYYNTQHPDVVQCVAMGYVEELPLEGILLWDEQVVYAPRGGVLTYPSPLPRRVAKGDMVAAIDGSAVRIGASGYFFPALDGEEGDWVYPRIWPGTNQFPALKKAELLENGAYMAKGDAIGKLAYQPQELRCIAYLDKTPALFSDIKHGFIDIRMRERDKIWRATVRAYSDMALKIKVYLTLPFFPPSFMRSRAFSCSVLTGNRQGVSIPGTAVVVRDAKMGVLLLDGRVTKFTEIDGFQADGDSFFVVKGLSPGSVVVRYANKVKEGAVILW
ncbi:hypothetical protein FACS1894187_25290 [Synergistales bacterium]|nr:hypothetical protein FACS1894187_25290 [Synergistales bacterium]